MSTGLGDGVPFLEEFITWDHTCAVCAFMIGRGYCLEKKRFVDKAGTCEKFKERKKT